MSWASLPVPEAWKVMLFTCQSDTSFTEMVTRCTVHSWSLGHLCTGCPPPLMVRMAMRSRTNLFLV